MAYPVVGVIAGEDLHMGDYLVVGDDGKVYRMRKNDKRIKLSRAHNDASAGEIVRFTVQTAAVEVKRKKKED